MSKMGFGRVYTEVVTIPKWTRGDLSVAITSPFPHDLVAVSLGGSVGTDGQTLRAQVVQFTDLDDLRNASEQQLKGKIAYISFRMRKHIDGKGYGEAVGARGKGASIAAAKGAVAFMLRSVGTDNNRIAHTGGMTYQKETTKIPAIALSNPDADLLDNMLKRQQAVEIALNSSAIRYSEEVQTANVIGEITGSEHPEQVVAIGAHLDSWDVGTGAMDDGMGVAMVIASAASIGRLEFAPKRTIRVILFGAEEIGLYGAKQYVRNHVDQINNHVIGAEWDFGLGKIYQMTSGVGEQSLEAVRELADHLSSLGISFDDRNDAKAQSDMSKLSELGMPAIKLSPDGTDYFDLHHTDNDTFDKIDPDVMKQATAAYTVFAWFSAQSDVDFRQ
jgi:Zn-dependent M28 family amino/carboxypeptidase